MSSKLVFLDVEVSERGNENVLIHKIQIMASKKEYANNNFDLLGSVLKRGDIIGVEGTLLRTKTGELSIAPTSVTLLAPCMHDIPEEITSLVCNFLFYLIN